VTRLAGLSALTRLAMRRDRVLVPVWIAVFVVVAASSASATEGLYPTVADRVQAARAANATPALVAFYGKVYDVTSVGGIGMLKLTALGSVLVAVLMAVLVVRHTRGEEESGRLDVVGAGVVSRRSPLVAALLLAVGASALLGLLSALGVMVAGLPAEGSLAFGLTWAVAGIEFAAVAAVAAQLTESARAATSITVAALGAAYLLRAVGDSAADGGATWLSWLSPVGWAQQIRPFGGDRWWVAALPLVFAAVMVTVAMVVVSRRDVGAGLLQPRLGPASASPVLRSAMALAWRLHRTALLLWAVAFAVLGAVLGSIASDVGSLLESPQARDLIVRLGGISDLTDAFLAAELGFVSVFASAFGIQAALRMRSEEAALRASPVLATSVSRVRWTTSHAVVALGGASALVLVAGAAAGLTHQAPAAGGVGHTLVRLVGAALVQLPAVWLLTALALAFVGVAPRFVVGAWVALVLCVLLGEIGSALGLPPRLLDVSPFTHVPKLPGGELAAAPLVWLTVVAAGLLVVAFAGLRRRDVE
jgi:ABC-2 type transport system permease protein